MRVKKAFLYSAIAIAIAGVGSVAMASRQASAYNIFGGDGNPTTQTPCSGDNQVTAKNSTLCGNTGASDPIAGPNGIIHKATRILGLVSGAVAVIMMIVGGFMYVISNGDSGKINTARDTLIYAAVGLGIIAVSQTIIIFVIDRIK